MDQGRRRNLFPYYLLLAALVTVSAVLFWAAGHYAAQRPAAPSSSPDPSLLTSYPALPPTPPTPVAYVPPPTQPPTLPPPTPPPPPTDAARHQRSLTATAGAPDGLIYDYLNGISLRVPPGWYTTVPDELAVMGVLTLSNYDPYQASVTAPADYVSAWMFSQDWQGASFEAWLDQQRAGQVAGPDVGLVLTEPVRQTLGEHKAVTYWQTTSDGQQVQIIYLLTHDRQVLGITVGQVSEAGQAARAELDAILASIVVLP